MSPEVCFFDNFIEKSDTAITLVVEADRPTSKSKSSLVGASAAIPAATEHRVDIGGLFGSYLGLNSLTPAAGSARPFKAGVVRRCENTHELRIPSTPAACLSLRALSR